MSKKSIPVPKEIIDEIRRRRLADGLTVPAQRKELALDQSSYYRILKGGPVHLETLTRLQKYVGMRVAPKKRTLATLKKACRVLLQTGASETSLTTMVGFSPKHALHRKDHTPETIADAWAKLDAFNAQGAQLEKEGVIVKVAPKAKTVPKAKKASIIEAMPSAPANISIDELDRRELDIITRMRKRIQAGQYHPEHLNGHAR